MSLQARPISGRQQRVDQAGARCPNRSVFYTLEDAALFCHAVSAARLAAVGGADHDAAVVGGRKAVHLAQQHAQQPPRGLVHVAAARSAQPPI